ncbi:FixH family protein [Paenibacillus sp. P26]|nr:FixH family protein [Paenibacillus sp. P26]
MPTMNSRIWLQILLPAALLLPAGRGLSKEDASTAHHSMAASTPGAEIKVTFATSPAAVKTGVPVQLCASVRKGNDAVPDADVVLEIWKADDPNGAHLQQRTKYDPHTGYVVEGSFVEAGVYQVLVHATTSEAHQMISAKFEVRDGS